MLKLRKLRISQTSGKKEKKTIDECTIDVWNKDLTALGPHHGKIDLDLGDLYLAAWPFSNVRTMDFYPSSSSFHFRSGFTTAFLDRICPPRQVCGVVGIPWM